MCRYITIFILIIVGSTVLNQFSQAKNYAVLISAGESTTDNAEENSEYWYDLFLQYTTLIDKGYDHEDVYVLYGEGFDFISQHLEYHNPYPIASITDFNNYKLTIESVFNSLDNVMTDNDLLYVWWMGHGMQSLGHLRMRIENVPGNTSNGWVWDYEFASFVNQISNYRIRIFSVMTCFSGGIIDDLDKPKTIVITSSTFNQLSYSAWLCDNWHAELHYYETCAFHWTTPFGLGGTIDADYDENGCISFEEAFLHSEYNMLQAPFDSEPQLSDPDCMAGKIHLGHTLFCCPSGSCEFTEIQKAIDAACQEYKILLENGTYTGSGNRDISYGGKAIAVRSSANDYEHCVIDCLGEGRGFLFHSGEDADSTLEGVTVANGNADMSNPTVSGCGGGILCYNNSSPGITNCKIMSNSAEMNGGAVYCRYGSSPVISGCTILNNSAEVDGGAIYCRDYSSPEHVNCVVIANDATDEGGGVHCCFNSSPVFVNCTLADNYAEDGGGIYCWKNSSPAILNTIMWDNSATAEPEIVHDITSDPAITCSDVKGGWMGAGNISTDPLFMQPVDGDYHLSWMSPCINRGTNTGAPLVDIDGDERPCLGTVDMGSDEFTGNHSLESSSFEFSEQGDTVFLTLDAMVINGGRKYLMAGGITGTAPGQLMPGGLTWLPINFDVFTYSVVFPLINTVVFMDFVGTLKADGTGEASIMCGPLDPGCTGIKMYYAYCLGWPWEFVSNPVEIEIVP